MYKIYSVNNNEEVGIFLTLKKLSINYYGELLFLDKYLDKIIDYNKLVLINVLPIDNISSNIVDINKENIEYINKIHSIAKKYKNININYCSTSTRILNSLQQVFIHNNCGYYVSNDLNYPDNRFYIFPEEKTTYKNLKKEIDNNKKIFIVTSDDTYSSVRNDIMNNYNNYDNIFLIKKTT